MLELEAVSVEVTGEDPELLERIAAEYESDPRVLRVRRVGPLELEVVVLAPGGKAGAGECIARPWVKLGIRIHRG